MQPIEQFEPRITQREVKRLCGDISDMTLWRWREQADFPCPDEKINGRNYWRKSRVIQWWKARNSQEQM